MSTSVSVPESGRIRLLTAPFRQRTWRHVLYALVAVGPLLLFVLPYAMKSTQGHGAQQLGVLVLLVMLVVVAFVGPVVERLRSRLLLGEDIGHRQGAGRVGRGLLFMLVNLLTSTVSFGLVVGWFIVSARNLTYPIWGWAPYPDPAWGGPSPAGAVALHFAAGVVAFFCGPLLIVTVTNWQVRVARSIIGAG
ncbi:sensor domain-containing protein [Streptomyces sp. NBC_00859]|uniref:sensor domain-containing protein n=1 Tax=Streptomyces sp. NBC_00859 TaxID=2903682 RepID=UPI003867DFA9|nr:sensor domain-containing protein [Streptomyces sp. NBC_00859]